MNGETSPRTIARLTALFYLLTIVGGVFAQGLVSDRLVDFKNPGVTAANILANETLYRTAFSVFMIEMSCQIITSVLFYQLLKPVNRNAALVATALSLSASIIKTTARTFFIAPVSILHSGGALWSTWYWPPLGSKLFMVSAVFALIGVAATCACMLIYGVDEVRWRERAAVAASSIWR